MRKEEDVKRKRKKIREKEKKEVKGSCCHDIYKNIRTIFTANIKNL